MWKDYSESYLKNNRASGRSIMAAAFIATMFLSLLCSIAYNFQIYDLEKVTLEEGERQYAQPTMLTAVYLGILTVAVISLILVIRGSFELSMQARIHQFGIFSSIGATPKQIRVCLLQEAAALSVLPVMFGLLTGVMICFGLLAAINFYAADVAGRHQAVFHYHPAIFLVTVLSSALTVLFSAWVPARKLAKMTPLEAIRNAESLQLKRRKHSRILSLLFGVEGELAGNALKAQRKSLRISTLSLLFSFLGFSVMLVMTTLADISTRYTYFERYQDAWDVMVTLKDTGIEDFAVSEERGEIFEVKDETSYQESDKAAIWEELENLPGVRDATVYQKADGVAILQEGQQSDELIALGGLEILAGITEKENQYQVTAPIVILDDASFLKYCEEIGIAPSLDGAIILNRIWDSVDSNFRYREYVPFVKEDKKATVLLFCEQETAEIPVLSYTQTAPLLREEYADYGLVHFIPVAMWRQAAGKMGTAEADSYIRIFSAGNGDLVDLNSLEEEVKRLVEPEYNIESENRVNERLSNDRMINGMKVILGGLCVLLAVIGIANIFSTALGFLRQRKREFAQYMSIGLTPWEMGKMFCIEAFVIAGRPLLITVPFTLLFVEFALRVSYLDRAVFLAEAPAFPIFLFAVAMVLSVALAYYIGGKRILRCDLSEALRSDTLG
ncbi:MAG: ABC transporter permease [Lachnospiraceae bacterium]|nr:ABC transporter permease [Lachnospiraceae bacterium]